MAKTIGPLFSEDAHGSISKLLSYSHKKSGKQVRLYNKPAKVATAKQRGQRRVTEFLVAQWQNMSAPNKATWATNAAASGLNIAGYHYFLREAQRDLYTHHGLVGYWHCNDIVNGKVLDLSGNANHGALKPSYPINAPALQKSMNTRFSNGLRYDGTDDHVLIANSKSLNITAAISILGWIYVLQLPKVTSKSAFILSGQETYILWVSKDDNKLYGRITDGGRPRNVPAAANPIVANKWYMGAFTYDGNIMRVFLNKNQITSQEYEGDIDIRYASKAIGAYSGASIGTNCIIDEVALYNRALSPEEIATRYKFATRKVS